MRTITVKGVGSAKVAPDCVELLLTARTREREYQAAQESALARIESLREALCEIGFERGSLKTTGFGVDTAYDRYEDTKGHYQRVFVGYEVTHRLKLTFGLSMSRLSEVLDAISHSSADPELSMRFTVENPAAVQEELLASAAQNAREKARVLAAAAGVSLGSLESIRYDWAELDVYSNLDFSETDCGIGSLSVEPDDIALSDTATFVWQLA